MKIIKNLIFLLVVCISGKIALAQQNDPPQWTWAKNVGGSAISMTSDSIGNSYVVGLHSSNVTFGSTTLAGSGVYVVKYDSTGAVLWARQAATGLVDPKDIAVDALGDYYITGSFSGSVTVGGFGLTSAGLTDVFYARFNEAGTAQWANRFGGVYDDNGSAIAVDLSGNCLVSGATGGYNGSMYYDEILTIKLDASGVSQWVRQVSGNWENFNYSGNRNQVNGIAVDDFGNSYITGNYKPFSGSDQFFLLKYDPSGNQVWLRGVTGFIYGNDVAVDAVGNTYTTGRFTSSAAFGSFNLTSAGLNDAFVVKYDAAGQVSWARSAGGVDNDYGDGIAIDASGNPYVTGRFQQNASFPPISVSNVNSGVSDVFVTKYNSIGEVQWVSQAGNSGVDAGMKIGLDKANNCYLNGIFTTSISFGTSNLSGGSNSSYLAKIGSNVQDSLAIFTDDLGSHTYIAGSAIAVSFSAVGTFSPDNVFRVELSDASGGFFYPVSIGTGVSSPITAVIPPLTIPASSYRVRVVASDPSVTGRDNGSNIAINSSSQQITPQWSWGINSEGSPQSIATDTAGNSYVVGLHSTNVTFGSTTLAGSGVYVVKYDSTGAVLWARQAATGLVDPKDIAVDALGDYYITGSFSGSVTVGGFGLTSAGLTDVFYARFNEAGTAQWANRFGGVYDDNGSAIAVDLSGNCLVSGATGGYNGSMYYDEILTIKLDVSGVSQWVRQVSGNWENFNYSGNRNQVNGIAVDDFGNSYITGNYKPFSGSDQFFLLKYDPSGNQVWLRGVTGFIYGNDVAVDAVGNTYTTGRFTSSAAFGSFNLTSAGLNDAFVVKYDAAGQVSWARSAGGVDNDYGDGIAIDASGSPYVTGRFQHSAYFSGINISNFNSGVSDVFVAKYAGTGSAVWVKQAGETGMDRGVKIGVTPSGTCFVTGTYDFEINFDQFALTGTANKSYVASIGSTYQTSIGNAILIAGTKICGGNVLKIEYPVTGVFNAGNTFTAQLSDASGDFTSPTNIGSVSTALNNTIYAVIPDVATGTGYHIRVISSNPGLTGPDNGIDLSINLGACDSVTPALESFPIVAGEYFFDTDPGIGNGQAISVTQGDSVSLSLSISAAGLSAGFHNLFVRFKDSRNVWSLYDGRIIYIQPEIEEETVLSSIVSGEYFFDTDPGVGNGTPLAAFTEADSISITSQISVAGLTEGFHNLFIRMKDTANVWSLYEGRIINIQADVEETVVSSIVSGEYFFNTDPGVGNGIPLPSFTQADSISITSQVSAAGLPFGFNNLFIRVKDTAGVWSLYEGRKFFICSDVLATPVISGNTAVCSGSGLNLSGSTVTGAISYLWTGPGGFSQAGTDLTRTNMNASIAGAYTFYAIRAGGTKCDSSLITVNVTVNPVYTVNNPQVICQGGSYAINGNSYATAGTYKDTLVSVNGCDSIIVTQLTVNPVYQTDNIQDICDGESYTINGNTYTADGTYTDVMQSVNGCDSTVVTYLTIHPLQTVNNPQMICTGGSYTINGNTYTADGTYTDVLQSIYGCDSTVITQLSVVTSFNINNPVTICQGESYTVGANTYTTAGTYNDLLVSALGCDSMVTTVLTVNAVFAVNNPQTICQGDSYTIGANTYTSNGTYTDVLQSVNGCDSTVTTVLTVIPLQTVNNPQQICTGGSYTIAGNTYTTAGTYTDILQSVDGCDSTVITQLTVNPVHTVNNPQTICAGESYTVGANTYSIAGTYVDVLQSVGGCDSTVTTVLTVNPVSSATNPQTICSGESYQIGGNTYTTAGTYTDILQAVNGCDSTVTTILTVNVSPVVNNPQVICQGESYTIGSSTYTIAGTYNDVFQAVNGCDSTIVTQLTVNPVYAVNNPQTICLGESYTINGNVYTTAGNYTDVLQSVQGCDSVVTTQLTVNNPVLDLTVTEAGSMLTAVESNATYQWIDCGNGNAEINGETSQSFTSTVNGEFAVVLTTLQCDVSDTSLCITIDNVGIAQIESVMGISVYPNPAQDKITIETGGAPGEVFIFNAEGKQVYSRKMLTAEMTVDVSKWSKGLYVVEVYSGDGIARRKIIKE